jgi:beta-lactamase regulating signal transducer with metallopeptidase domain/Tol biopolymer transport system component
MTPIINDCLTWFNRLGEGFCTYAGGAFVQSALLVLLLIAVDLLLRKRVRAVVRYCIWLLVLVKLVLPPTLALPTGIGYWLGDRPSIAPPVSEQPLEAVGFEPPEPSQVATHAQPSNETSPSRPPAPALEPDGLATPAASSVTPVTWQAILLLLWFVGALAFAALLVQRVRFVRGLVAASVPVRAELLSLLAQCRTRIGVRWQVGLRTSDAIPSPAVCGLLRPTILMPTPLVERLSPEGLKAALIHELAHIKRADLWINAIQTFLQVVYFYNPFVWLANAMIRRTCEEAVDETVLVTLGGRAGDYSNTLINIGEMAFWKADFGLRLVGVAESKRALKRRIRHMLTRPIPQTAKIGAFGTIAILLIAATLLPMARAERSNEQASTPSAAAVTEASETTLPAEANDVIVDPNTGVKFVLAKTFSGANNVIPHVNKLILSPDARFLVHWGKVLPLDGTETFRYTERSGDVSDVAVSPNGRYIAHGEHTVWLQPVSPETLRPDGPAKKLLDLRGGRLALAPQGNRQKAIYWTRDSQTIFFPAFDADGRFHQYAFSAATGAPVSYPDAVSAGLPSPDGKCVALTLTGPRGGFWVKLMGDGAARMLCEAGPGPSCWSKDGHWLIGVQPWGGARFVSYPEGKEYYLPLPKQLAEDGSASGLGPSADRSKLFFYQASTKLTYGVRVAPAEGTALSEVDVGPSYRLEGFQWAPDGRTVFHHAWTEQGESSPERETGLFASSFSGDKPVQLTLKPAVSAKATLLSVSPDGKWLLFTPARESGRSTVDLNVIPLSMADHKASGPATVVLRMTPPWPSVWSPDSTRVALTGKVDPADEEDIWVVFTDGRTPIRLTRTAAIERDLNWSPDRKMLAFHSDDAGVRELKVVPTAGGDATVIRKWAVADEPLWGWSPDSKSLTIAEEGMLVRQPLSGDKAEPIVNLKEFGIEALTWQGWSPDGSRLALACWKRPAEAPLTSYGQLLFARVEGGRLQQTGATDLGPATWTGTFAWSPDGTHVACEYEGLVAMRPEGRLYAVAVDDIVKRIEAGAIPPTRPEAAEPAVTETQSESKPAPQPEPITGLVFSDGFDNGLSKHWQIADVNSDASPPPAHAVENGQLMLSNCSACLSQIDWPDYLVTVRVCVKECRASGYAFAGIETRMTPSNFGIKDVDRYALNFLCFDNAPTGYLWIGLTYHNASGARLHAPLGQLDQFGHPTTVRGKWYKLAFEVRGERLRGYLDDQLVIETTDARLLKGALGLSAWQSRALFDDFSVRRLP